MRTVCIYDPKTKRLFTKGIYDNQTVWIAECRPEKINEDYSQSQMMDAKDCPASVMPEELRNLGDQSK